MRAIALLVFDFGLDPETVERMPVSRLNTYMRIKADLEKDREKQRSSK
jgi:hypothetical protein